MPNYITTNDVAAFLNYNNAGTVDTAGSGFVGGFPGDNGYRTFPSSGQVAQRIDYIEKWIDQQTRNSWTSQTVTNEFHDWEYYRWRPVRARMSFFEEGSVHLRFFPIKAFSSAAGDKIEVFTGQSTGDGYEDFLVTRTQGRNNDFWVDTNEGIIHFASSRPYRLRDAVRITYRYGESSVPQDIKYATVLLTAAQIVITDDYSIVMPEGTQQLPFRDKVEAWKSEANEIIDFRRRLIFEAD